MTRNFFIILVTLGVVVMCVFLMSRGSDSLSGEVEKKNKRGQGRGDYVRSVETNTNSEIRSKRRSSQVKVKPSPVTTSSGLTYQVLRIGSGEIPGPKDTVKVIYRGWIQGGEEFDRSAEGVPIEVQLNRVILGWQEGIQLMRVGAKYRFTIPPEIAYGERGVGDKILPNSTLVFDVELIGVK